MIKEHFPNSQFIIVSLKEGMFNNANVLFRTRFVDGCSAVSRTALEDKRPAAAGEDDGAPAKKKRKKENEENSSKVGN